jgi:hypothetical protein
MAALSGTVQVRGYASNPSFLKWQLDLLPNGDPNAGIFLALGETPGEFTYSLDTSKLPAGEHALRLRVVRQDSNYDEYVTRFTVGGASAATPAATATPAPASTTAAAATPAAAAAAAAGDVGVSSNGLAAPREGQAISGDFVVRGYASDPNFLKWQLDLLPSGNANAGIFLALGTTPGVFTYTLSTANLPAGQHALRLRVVRGDSNYNEYTTNFTLGAAAGATGAAAGTAAGGTATVTPPATAAPASGGTAAATGTAAAGGTAAAQPANGITAPADGATVSGSVPVRGVANSPSFLKWQLDLLLDGDPNRGVFLAVGDDPGEFTYTLDATAWPAGAYALRLRVVRTDSNYDEYTSKITIAQ